MAASEPIQVAVIRTVKPGSEKQFEQALHEFIQNSLALPGQLGVSIVRPAQGSASRQYGIIRKFADRHALIAFRTSPEYLAWNQLAADLTEGSGRVQEFTGLESWFTLPGELLHALPRWKMALSTYLGVVIVVMSLSLTLGPLMSSWNFLLRTLVFNAGVVATLTWVVMPVITRVLHPWLSARHL